MEMKFYRCSHCGQIIAIVKATGVPIVCCGEPMAEVVPGTTDASLEKHVPVVETEGNVVTVKVGSVEHPMTDEHFIKEIIIETKCGIQIAELNPADKPEAKFALADGDELVAAYEYCTLHGLWKK